MKNRAIYTVVGGLMLFLAARGGEAADITVNSRIAVDTQKASYVKAAEDLSGYLEKITGRKVAVEDQSVPADGRYTIAVGDNSHTLELEDELKGMDIEGFIIKSSPGQLLIRGFNEKATEYGVNYFLQEYCGVRWFLPLPAPLGTVVPKQDGIHPGIFTDRQEPSFGIREFAAGKDGADFKFRNMVGARRWFVHHNLDASVMPIRTYHRHHPEYYFPPNNPLDGWFGACTSNPEVLQLFIDYAVNCFNRNPHMEVVPMGWTDGQRPYCRCDNCLAQEGTDSDRMYTFYDKVAKGLQEKHPGKKVGVLVYAGVKDLPSPEVMERIDLGNLAGGLPGDQTDWFAPRARAGHEELIRSWSRHLDRFFIWGWFSLRSNTVPTMNIRVISEMMKFARDLGNCDGMYNETSEFHALHGPQMWVMAQLLWNIDRDVDALLKEFCYGMFGMGGPWMERYYNHIQEVWWRQETGEVKLWGNYPGELDLFTREDMDKLNGYLLNAHASTDTDDDRARINMMAGGFKHVHLLWELHESKKRGDRIMPVSSDTEAEYAKTVMDASLKFHKELLDFRENVISGRKELEYFTGFWWLPSYSELLPDIYRYFAVNGRAGELTPYLNVIAGTYSDLEAGRLAQSLSARAATETEESGLLLRATFDRGLDADFSIGSPVAYHNTAITSGAQGWEGEAAILRDGNYLVYKGKGNFNPRKGAIIMRVKPDSGSTRYVFTVRSSKGLIISWGSGARTFDFPKSPHHVGHVQAREWISQEEWQGKWHEVGFSYDLDDSTVHFLLNGAVVERTRMTVPDLSGTDIQIGIGHYVGKNSDFFGGLIDDVRIYSSYLDYLLDASGK